MNAITPKELQKHWERATPAQRPRLLDVREPEEHAH